MLQEGVQWAKQETTSVSRRSGHVFQAFLNRVMWQQDQSGPYAYPQEPLQFYAQSNDYYPASRTSLDAHVQGSIIQQPSSFTGNIQSQGAWWTAFGTGGFEGEPPLLEGDCFTLLFCFLAHLLRSELGINFQHILDKSLTVLNPLRRVDEHIMDDADLAGPIFFCFCFGISLLFVSHFLYITFCSFLWVVQSGKSNFNYIYGVGLFGSASLYTLLNLMSEQGIDAYRVASVLGYCLLPMVGVGAISVIMALEQV